MPDQQPSGESHAGIRPGVEIAMAAFSSRGLVLIVEGWARDQLLLLLADGLVGEFERIGATSPAFALRTVRPASAQDRRRSACALNALWRRPEFLEADRVIASFLQATLTSPGCARPEGHGADRHES